MKFFSKIFKLINYKEKLLIFFLTFFVILSMLLEVLSIGAVIPVLASLLEYNEFVGVLDFLNNVEFIKYIQTIHLNLVIICFVVIFLFKNIFIYLTQVFNSFVLNRITARLSKGLFNYFVKLNYENFTERKTAEMINLTSNVVDTFKETLSNIIILFTEIIVFVGIILFLIFIDPISILLVTLLSIIIFFIFFKVNKEILTKWGKVINKNREEKLQILYQSLNLIKNIKISNNFNYFLNNYDLFNAKEYKYAFLSSCITFLPKFLFEITGIILISFSIVLMTEINVNKNEIIIILSILGLAALRILPAVARITNSTSLLRFYKYSLDTIYSELIEKNLKLDKDYDEGTKHSLKRIEFKNVSFVRKENKQILESVNFVIKKGDNIGIKGLSGSGKTTFVDIICGLLKPSSGSLILNEKIELKNFPGSTPLKIGYVPQDIFLTNDSLEKNIAFGVPTSQINHSKILDTMRLCKLDKFINNNKTLANICVGDGGTNISGGERQRIGIARAIYNDPDLLIFDEFTSSLDSNTENEILSNLNPIIKNKTVIFISHKDSALSNCKKIYEFKHKKIIET